MGSSIKDNKEFWEKLDILVNGSRIVVDRPRKTCHPKFKDTVYPFDYGYLENTSSMDGEGIDVFLGTDENRRVCAIICTVDLFKRDSEITILIGCSHEEREEIFKFINKYDMNKGIMIERDI